MQDQDQIFVTYAREDDRLPPDCIRSKGFVSFLQRQLIVEIQKYPEPHPKLWRDTGAIERGSQFEPLIDEAITDSSLLLVILSPNWLASAWCRRELDAFARRWSKEGELGVRRRIVVVNKHHIRTDERPLLLQGQEGYDFFSLDGGKTGRELPYFTKGGEIGDTRYWSQVKELARYLWELPAIIERTPPKLGPATGRTVYLAKPAIDMRQPYGRMVEELQRRGYSVVPAATDDIPHDSSATEFVKNALEKSEVSIHLLGEKPGSVPEDAEPIVRLQLARAADRALTSSEPGEDSNGRFRRIIWAPRILDDGTAPATSAAERDPLAVLEKFDRQLSTDKVDGGSISKFVEFVIQYLDQNPPRPPDPPFAITTLDGIRSDKRVYINHGVEDTDYAVSIAELLQKRQVEVVLPALDGDPAELKAFHRQNLRDCDTVVLCWAESSEVWMRANSSELRDWRMLGRTSGFFRRGLIEGPPPGGRKPVYVKLRLPKEIDVVLDLTAYDRPPPEEFDPLFHEAPVGG